MRALLLVISLFLLTACGANWQTSYSALSPEMTRDWRLGTVVVFVPETLTVSEANSFTPEADIVWREDQLGDGGSRYAQVDAIVTEGIQRGASGLPGARPVKIEATVRTFHALSEKARYGLSGSGVHNITYVMQVFDQRSGAPLTEPQLIQADLVAFVGDQALEAEAQGLTQKVRITDHIAMTTAGYLGIGPDNTNTFGRIGR